MPRLIGKYFKAKELRKKGYSLKEISVKLQISKSTASVWLRDVNISKEGMKRVESREEIRRLKSRQTKRLTRERKVMRLREDARDFLKDVKLDKKTTRLLCALIFCCEGCKDTRGGITFINSDPSLVKTFLALLRNSFDIDEKRFRALIHLHDYHSAKKQLLFWSKVTEIPLDQFSKPYRKPHTGKRIRDGYPGCASIRYYDSIVGKKLAILAQEFFNKYTKGA